MSNQRIAVAALTGLLFLLPSIAGAYVAISDVWTSTNGDYTIPSQAGGLNGGSFSGNEYTTVENVGWGPATWTGPGTVTAYREVGAFTVHPTVGTVAGTGARNDVLTPVPEPTSLILLGGGLLGLAGALRRKKVTGK